MRVGDSFRGPAGWLRSERGEPGTTGWLLALGVLCTLGLPRAAHAHPVPKSSHDRNVVVRLAADRIVVDYHLEVDAWTAIFEDLPAVESQADLTRLSEPHDFYEVFTRTAAPALAGGLHATLDGHPLHFACVQRRFQEVDSLQCDFRFQADPLPGGREPISADGPHTFTFREDNYKGRPGLVQLTLVSEPGVQVLKKTEPDEVLRSRPAGALTLEDQDRLRSASATVERASPTDWRDASPTTGPLKEQAASNLPPASGESPPSGETSGKATTGSGDLVHLFLRSRHGPLLLLLLSAFFGAAHALTPGHGKTLVAAYLVGERGTTVHALVLGLVTTLTHTGVVLVLALGLRLFFPQGMTDDVRQNLHQSLELLGGLLVAGLGCWLLLRRLAGQADHVHLGGAGHHHHHHGPHHHHHHHHHDHAHSHGPEDHHHHDETRVGWWGLITLGVSGGIVPCWDAVALLLAAVAMNLFWWALPMLLAFSAGLAGVLILIGLLVVHTRSLVGSRFENGRLLRALPLLSALVVTGMGLWLCYSSLHPGTPLPGQ